MVCLSWILPVAAHQVDTVEFEFQKLKGIWRFHGELDIAYMLPERRWDPDAGPLDRLEVMKAPAKELERIRKETENTLRKNLTLTHGGKTLKWSIEFPDFKKTPFALPPENGGIALLTVRLVVDEQKTPGDFVVHWSSNEKATLIVLTEDSPDGQIVSVEPGGSLKLISVKSVPSVTTPKGQVGKAPKDEVGKATIAVANTPSGFQSWIWSGFLHVLPKGLDHMLFIFGLFVAVLALRPMLWQSLLFTAAHSLTLAVCALGWLGDQPKWPWVEIFIAFTIAFVGIETLMKCKVGKRRYITVFVFGLVHGLGFASVFLHQVRSVPDSKLLKPLLGFNLGVELAQICVILVAAAVFAVVPKKRRKMAQTTAAVFITLAGLLWMAQRIFHFDLSFGLL